MVGIDNDRFSLFDMDNILRTAGAERIDERASKKLRELLEDSASDITLKAKILSRHAGRNNVTPEDIRLAAQQIRT